MTLHYLNGAGVLPNGYPGVLGTCGTVVPLGEATIDLDHVTCKRCRDRKGSPIYPPPFGDRW